MRAFGLWVWLALATVLGCTGRSGPARRSPDAVEPKPSAGDLIVFDNATVIPMGETADEVLEGYSVVVQGGRIVDMAPTSAITTPADAKRVDATGKFIIPGLGELHSHLPPPQAPAWVMPQYFQLYVANGVTVVRGMLGAPNQL